MSKSTQTESSVPPMPWAPGTCPFHVKGLLYRGNIEFHDQFVPGGFAATLAHFRDEKIRDFFRQPFLAASWYDLAPVLQLSATGALLAGQPKRRFVRETARWNAHIRLQEIYRSLLVDAPEAVMDKIPRMVAQYCDFGQTEAAYLGERRGRVEHRGIPLFLSPWFAAACQGYFIGALELARATHIHVSSTSPLEADGQSNSVDVVRIRYDLAWT